MNGGGPKILKGFIIGGLARDAQVVNVERDMEWNRWQEFYALVQERLCNIESSGERSVNGYIVKVIDG